MYWKRSEAAIQETRSKYGKLCERIAANILSNKEDVEECINDAYLGAWNAIPPEKPDHLSSYLCRITRNIALKKYSYNKAQKRDREREVPLMELEECLSDARGVEQHCETEHLAKVISGFLRALDWESRNVFLRRYWFYDPVAEIADRFAMSESKVKSMLFRTRKKLRICMEKEGVSL